MSTTTLKAKGKVNAPVGAIEARQYHFPLRTEAKLREFIKVAWGVEIPDVQVCPNHTTPWRAFADAYFARSRVAVWKACVPGDSIIYTEHGAVRVEDIEIGARVWGMKDGCMALGIISDKWRSGIGDIYEINTRAGTLRCNGRHQVLVRHKFLVPRPGRGGYRAVEWRDVFIEACQIRTGGRYQADLLVHPFDHDNRTQCNVNGIVVTMGLAELCGLLLGDGNIQEYKFLIAHHRDAGYMPHYYNVVEDLFDKAMRPDPDNRCSWLHSKMAAQLLKSLKVDGTAHTKRVPWWAWEMPRELKIAFLRGYLDGDGTARKDGVEWYSANQMLLEDIRLLCVGIGLRVGRVTCQKMSGNCIIAGREVTRGDMFSLRCYDGDIIGSNDPKYSWPPRKPQGREHCGIAGIVYHRVLNVKCSGKQEVWDLTVDGTDTFTVDGYVTHNSRGFGGKSFLLALLGLTEAVTLKADVNVLGGSGEQSENVHKYARQFWDYKSAPSGLLASGPLKRETRLAWGNVIKALLASSRSVRGPHPQRLRLDEVDEMELGIFDAAMGQAMSKNGIPAQTVISSTHQHADGTMTEVLKRAAEKGWKVYEWCYKETEQGWLDHAEVEGKRQDVTAAMWNVEYNLQEPSPESRAIQPASVEAMFKKSLGEFAGRNGELVESEPPDENGEYSTGADWAKKKDWTIIVTLNSDAQPVRVVAFERTGRLPWPVMVGKFDKRLERYGGAGTHDGTGLGDVVGDHLASTATGFVMTGRARSDLLSNYIAAVERGEVEAPMIEFMYNEHKYASVDDVYGSGHLPDSIAAMALAWHGIDAGQLFPFGYV